MYYFGQSALVHLAIASCFAILSVDSFWLVGMVGSKSAQLAESEWEEQCMKVNGMSPSQIDLCRENPDHMAIVAQGASAALRECQYQFRTDKWNCSVDTEEHDFGTISQSGYKETAFIHAISSAGVAHAIARSCREGQLTKCGCSEVLRPTDLQPSDHWGTCGDNIAYGVRFSRKFVDAKEKERNHPRNSNGLKLMLMNMHNNDVGRLVVSKSAQVTCKCHGVSGSCAARTCWHLLPSFRKVGNALRELYESSVEVDFNKRGNRLQPREAQKARRSARSSDTGNGKDAFYYVEASPDYCQRNETTGIYGTTGRECQKSSKGADSCRTLCCGRGYNAVKMTQMNDCKCVFYWCCRLECQKCRTSKIIYTCK